MFGAENEYTYRKMGHCGFEWMNVGKEESFLGLKELSTSGRLSGIGGNKYDCKEVT